MTKQLFFKKSNMASELFVETKMDENEMNAKKTNNK